MCYSIKHIKKYSLLAMACTSILLGGCAQQMKITKAVDHQANSYHTDIQQAYKKVVHQNDVALKDHQQIHIKNAFYIERTHREPFWLKEHLDVNGQYKLSYLLTYLLSGHDINIQYLGGANPEKMVQVHFSGTVKQALALAAQLSGYDINTHGNTVMVKDISTDIFQIHTIPGQADYAVGKSEAQHEIGSIESSIGSSSSSDGKQYSQEKASVSAWSDIKSVMKSMLSPTGKFTISESTSTLTVTDHAKNLKRISQWMKAYNARLSQQVSFKVQLISVELNNSFQRGINWDAFFGSYHISQPDLLSGVLQSTSTAIAQGAGTTAFSILKGKSQLVISLLEKQGKVTAKNEPILTTLNNHMAQLRETQTIAYLQTVTNSLIPSATGTSSQQSFTPSALTTGVEMYVIPHIEHNKVYLKLSMSIASLDAMNSIDSKGGEGIQLPVVSVKRFNQDAILTNGQTLVVGGFKYNSGSYGNAKNFTLSALGAFSSQHSNTELVLMITPYVSSHK